jgi:hypothetical protein
MSNTTLNARISLRYDTYDKWNTSSGKAIVLNKGEAGVCAITADGATQPTIMFKIGNGISTFEELPWTSGLAADVYPWAKQIGINIIEEGQGEIITNMFWDEASNAIKIIRKTLTAATEAFATQGVIASCSDGTLTLSDATTKNAVVSVNLI